MRKFKTHSDVSTILTIVLSAFKETSMAKKYSEKYGVHIIHE